MSDVAVRPAITSDAGQIEPLAADALEALRGLRGGPALLTAAGVPADVPAPALASALCGGALVGTTTLVAMRDDLVAGFAVLVRTDLGVDLLGVHTARAMRRQGIGTDLLDAARSLAATEGARFDALALPGDQSSKSLLESRGFRARLLRMSADR